LRSIALLPSLDSGEVALDGVLKAVLDGGKA
jgi:hypothetical protein